MNTDKMKYIDEVEGENSYIDVYEVNGHVVVIATPRMGRDGIAITTIN